MPDPAPFVIPTTSGVIVAVRVIPRSGRTLIAGTRQGALLVRLAAAPVENAANEALIELLAERLQMSRRRIRLVSGHRGRDKRVEIEGAEAAEVALRLMPA